MECCNCCDYGPILSDEALNDRLYWVELLTGPKKGGRFTAWRDRPGLPCPWVISTKDHPARLVYTDDEIRIIHEIIPEE